VHLRLIAVFALAGALLGVAGSLAREPVYSARSYVVKVPPAHGTKAGLKLTRSDRLLARALKLAGSRRSPDWLRRHSDVGLTGRLDFAIEARAADRGEAIALATAYARAIRRSLPRQPGLATLGRGARTAARPMGTVGWGLLGAAGGLWLGAAAAILRTGSGRGPRRASPPCAPASGATPG
jgi:hypothetical protein